jgi:hypothetical protein
MPDVNYLLHRQQISLLQAAFASCPESRAAHEDMARAYLDQVRDYARANRQAITIRALATAN